MSTDLTAWLGPIADTATADQRDAIDTAHATIVDRWPHPDLSDDREQALTGAVQVIVGDDTVAGLGQAYRAAAAAAEVARLQLVGAIIAAAQSGAAETRIAEQAGIDRMTVRKALGK